MSQDKEIKKAKRDRVAVILYVAYLFLLAASLLLIGKIIGIQVAFKPEPAIESALTPSNNLRLIEPARGNIIDSEGRLLALSCPIYQFYMDCTVLRDSNNSKEEAEWRSKAKELSKGLSAIFKDKSADQYYKLIISGRENGRKYVKIGTQVEYDTYKEIKSLPLFREGRYRSGMQFEQENIRKYPYGKLARRTIGFVRNNKSDVGNTHIGLEGRFDYLLHGQEGREWLRSTDYGQVRNNDSTFVKAEDGKDLFTTLNIDYQEIADKALRTEIEGEDDLEGGCLVLMEVKTGAIRAMVNLSRDAKTGKFEEIQNLAIGRKAEPGSVFKTVTLMSVLSDGFVKTLDQTMPTNHGMVSGTKHKQDSHIVQYEREHRTNRISVLDGFKMSSNYVFATLAVQNYAQNPMRYIQNIYSYKLGEAFEFDLDGLATPKVPTPETIYWTNTDLGSIGYGYSTEETPLHILTFYNAIANKGRMMKPYLVEGPAVLNSAICSHAVADTLVRALKAVTEEGTAKLLKTAKCSVAGKTGTSFGTYENGKYEDAQGRRKYQGTFAGFFPSEDPVYSVICVIYSKPTNKSFQGGGIPARAIKTVIDRIYNIDPHWREEIRKTK